MKKTTEAIRKTLADVRQATPRAITPPPGIAHTGKRPKSSKMLLQGNRARDAPDHCCTSRGVSTIERNYRTACWLTPVEHGLEIYHL